MFILRWLTICWWLPNFKIWAIVEFLNQEVVNSCTLSARRGNWSKQNDIWLYIIMVIVYLTLHPIVNFAIVDWEFKCCPNLKIERSGGRCQLCWSKMQLKKNSTFMRRWDKLIPHFFAGSMLSVLPGVEKQNVSSYS